MEWENNPMGGFVIKDEAEADPEKEAFRLGPVAWEKVRGIACISRAEYRKPCYLTDCLSRFSQDYAFAQGYLEYRERKEDDEGVL